MCGVNHFSSTNTKVGKNYQKGNAPFLRRGELILAGNSAGKQSNSVSKDSG